MASGRTRSIIAGSLVALTGLGVFALLRRSQGRGSIDREVASAQGRGPAYGQTELSGAPAGSGPPAESPASVKLEVDGTLSRWRTAVLVKDAASVVALDRTFRELPDRYSGALARSAEHEGNERVRAFSTRVLGSLERPELAPLYERLLADKSVYVRQNAAWALGELGAAEDGREAAAVAVAELRHVRARDPANEVRLAAKDALDKLE